MKKVITCLEPLHGLGKECGDMIQGKDDDDIVAKVRRHLKDVHGGMQISREKVLSMAKSDTARTVTQGAQTHSRAAD